MSLAERFADDISLESSLIDRMRIRGHVLNLQTVTMLPQSAERATKRPRHTRNRPMKNQNIFALFRERIFQFAALAATISPARSFSSTGLTAEAGKA